MADLFIDADATLRATLAAIDREAQRIAEQRCGPFRFVVDCAVPNGELHFVNTDGCTVGKIVGLRADGGERGR